MTVAPVYGRLLTATQVEAAMRDHMQEWLRDYLAEIERQTGRASNSLPRPTSYRTAAEFTKFDEDRLPQMVLVSPGLIGEPVAKGDKGQQRATWGISVVVAVSARTMADTDALAKAYAAAIRGAVIQHRSLGDFARGTAWMDERYDTIDTDGERNLMGVTVSFAVEVDDVVSTKLGTRTPVQPSSGAYNPAPVVPVVPDADHVIVQIDPASLAQPLP